MNVSSNIPSPITNNPHVVKAPTSARQDEPIVIEITPRNVFRFLKEFLCRMLKPAPTHPQSHAPTI